MTTHLNDEQMVAALSGDTRPASADHLAECVACAAEVAQMQAELRALPAVVHQAAARDEGFWRTQRLAISSRMTQAPAALASLRWGVGFAALVLAALLLNRAPAAVEFAQVDPDHALLVEVEQSVRRSVPQALEPAQYLVYEMSRAELRGNP
jgi:anti-sigma factor RsiW